MCYSVCTMTSLNERTLNAFDCHAPLKHHLLGGGGGGLREQPTLCKVIEESSTNSCTIVSIGWVWEEILPRVNN